MGLLKSATDLVFTIRFLKLLVTPFEKLGAFKAGIIDKDGKKNPDFNTNSTDDRAAYRTHYTPFIRMAINLKRLLAKAPGGQSVIARYGAALLLIKEHGELPDNQLEKIIDEAGIDPISLVESTNKWFVLQDGSLGPGIYRMLNDTVTIDTIDDLIKKGDKIRIEENHSQPVDNIMGMDIYRGVHLNSMKNIYISTGEITR
tara:strand:- start:441 stop:1043 length:603 start_codon:yes stop_codon:yes gene_type:complete